MIRRLDTRENGFAAAFSALLRDRSEAVDGAEETARLVIDQVQKGGLAAVLDLTRRLDGVPIQPHEIRLSADALEQAASQCDPDVLRALRLAFQRIVSFHEKEKPGDASWTDPAGLRLGWRWTAVDAAGVYAPGGLAAYPSSVLMNVAPAKVAGVRRIVLTTPPARLHANPAILAAAHIAGVDEVWTVGGAQAIAALAYGAGPLLPVDVVVGPGNAYVAAAKRLVFGHVGIDSVAGPSEVFIVADDSVEPAWLAADLLAQAEHDEAAQSILFTDSPGLADRVIEQLEEQLGQGLAGRTAGQALADHGALVLVRSLDEAIALCNEGAPEHLQLATREPDRLLLHVRHAGAVFLGGSTPEAIGDYVAGPNHVLPTGRRARYASGLSTLNFMKRTTLVAASRASLECGLGAAAVELAAAEGLPAHRNSVALRLAPNER